MHHRNLDKIEEVTQLDINRSDTIYTCGYNEEKVRQCVVDYQHNFFGMPEDLHLRIIENDGAEYILICKAGLSTIPQKQYLFDPENELLLIHVSGNLLLYDIANKEELNNEFYTKFLILSEEKGFCSLQSFIEKNTKVMYLLYVTSTHRVHIAAIDYEMIIWNRRVYLDFPDCVTISNVSKDSVVLTYDPPTGPVCISNISSETGQGIIAEYPSDFKAQRPMFTWKKLLKNSAKVVATILRSIYIINVLWLIPITIYSLKVADYSSARIGANFLVAVLISWYLSHQFYKSNYPFLALFVLLIPGNFLCVAWAHFFAGWAYI